MERKFEDFLAKKEVKEEKNEKTLEHKEGLDENVALFDENL